MSAAIAGQMNIKIGIKLCDTRKSGDRPEWVLVLRRAMLELRSYSPDLRKARSGDGVCEAKSRLATFVFPISDSIGLISANQ